MLRHSLFASLPLALFLVFSIPGARAATPDACVEPRREYRDAYFRTLQQPGSATVWLASHGDQVDVCIALAKCFWKLTDVPIARLGSFSDLAGETNRCSTSAENLFFLDTVIHSNCDTPKELASRLSLLERWLAGIVVSGSGCGSRSSPLNDLGFVTDDGPVLVLQAPAPPMCFVLAVSLTFSAETFALITPSCTRNVGDVGRLRVRFATETVRRRPEVAWIGAGIDSIGFAVAANSDGTGPAEGVDPAVWGGAIDKSYVAAWLTRVGAAAKAYDEIDKDDDPLPGAASNDFAGRLAKWLTAGLMRVGAKPFSAEWLASRSARNWMARNVLSGVSTFEGTLLRGEEARRDWR